MVQSMSQRLKYFPTRPIPFLQGLFNKRIVRPSKTVRRSGSHFFNLKKRFLLHILSKWFFEGCFGFFFIVMKCYKYGPPFRTLWLPLKLLPKEESKTLKMMIRCTLTYCFQKSYFFFTLLEVELGKKPRWRTFWGLETCKKQMERA